MGRSALHRVLERPSVYRLAQWVLAPGSGALYRAYDALFHGSRGRVLDVGSGPRVDTPLPAGAIIGIDVNVDYLRRYARPSAGERADCRKLAVASSAAAIPFRDAAFDETRCAAVLHHLPDAAALATIREMVRVVRPGGRVVVFDNCWPPSFARAPVAWLLCRFDRGEWVRRSETLEAIARRAYDGPWQAHAVTFSWYRIHGLILTLEKPW